MGSYPSAEVQSVYSTTPADWANQYFLKTNMAKSLTHQLLLPTKFNL